MTKRKDYRVQHVFAAAMTVCRSVFVSMSVYLREGESKRTKVKSESKKVKKKLRNGIFVQETILCKSMRVYTRSVFIVLSDRRLSQMLINYI